ncbi:sensor histidine kinase [Streptomyces sp. NPDC008343]|uniref:sensor histidine kinase n=1 Tax=Streptomyces sp. NPDC008343 TaxID=3364828 RepID=UPI0036E017E0
MRRRLIMLAVITTFVGTVLLAVPLALYGRHAYLEEADQVAMSRAHLFRSVLSECDSHEEFEVFEGLREDKTDGTEAAAFLRPGKVVGANLPWTAAVDRAFEGRASVETIGADEAAFTPATTADGRRAVVAVKVDTSPQWASIHRLWAASGVVVLVLPLIAGLLTDRLGRTIVEPIDRLVGAAEQLKSGRLSTRVAPGGPAETRRLGEAFNALADRIEDLIVAEREAVADMSHRLRTPVTALMLQAESLKDPVESSRMLDTTRRLRQQISFLIEHARKPADERQRVALADLAAAVTERVDFWSPLAEEQNRRCNLLVTGQEHQVRACPIELTAAIDVLVENIFAHTPEGTDMRVAVQSGLPDGAVLVVEDDGPGLGDVDVIARGTSTRGSSGLGLDIVRQLAERSGGSMTAGHCASGGARIEVRMGGLSPAGARSSVA